MFRTVAGDRYGVVNAAVRASASSTYDQQGGYVTSLGSAGYVTVWTNTVFSNPSVVGQRFDLNGNKVGGEFTIATNEYASSVTTRANGNFVVTMTVNGQYPQNSDVSARIFKPDGTPVGSEFTVNTTLNYFQESGIVAPLANGGFVVSWLERGAGSYSNIHMQVFSADGTKVGGEAVADDAQPGDKDWPGVTGLAGGGFVVSWYGLTESDANGNLSTGSRAQLFDAAGHKVGAAFALNDIVPGYQYMPAIAALPSGGFVAAWTDDGNRYAPNPLPGNNGIWVQLFDSSAAKAGTAVHIPQLGSAGADWPELTVTSSGFLVTWRDGNATADAPAGHLQAQLFDFAGQMLGSSFAISPGVDAHQYSHSEAVLANGDIALAWTNSAAPNYSDNDVLSRLLVPVGHGGSGADLYVGTDGPDYYMGHDGNDSISGGAGNDGLSGGDGDDILDGGLGTDDMVGGAGNDIYVVDNSGDTVTENPGEGTDEVRTTLASYTLGANVENLTYIGTGAATLRGNALDNGITGGPNADLIDLSDGGHDHAVGGGGYDVFRFGGAFDSGDIVEGGAGIDEVHIQGAYGTITLGANLTGVESVFFYGHAIQGEGNPGASPYTYNVVVGAGITSDENSLYVAANLAANETLTVDGSAATTRLALQGGDGNDTLTGGVYDDWIYGGPGADTMIGGAGGDTYIVDNVADLIVEKPGEGEDTVSVSLATYALPDNVEDILGFNIDQHLTGNAADNKIYSGSGNDVIDGGSGADRMAGSSGNDIYYVDNAGDVVVENPGEGTDEVRTTLASYTLGANVENLAGLASSGQALTGNSLDNKIVSSGGPDKISGGDGNDTIAFSSVQRSASGAAYDTYGSIDGGAGYDVLDLTNVGMVLGGVFQTGPDTYATGIFVGSQVFFVTNVEKILLGAQADDFMPGTNLGPSIEMRGGGGDDYLAIGGNWAVYGEAGDDTIFIGDYGQVVTSGIIDGGSGVNTIDTYAGIFIDLAAGTAVVGAATYTVSHIQNAVVGTSEGVSSVTGDDAANAFSVQPYDSGTSGVLFHGGGGDDLLTGGGGGDLLDGGTGADDMRGGTGDDIYVVDNVDDKVTELAGGGRDVIGTSLATFVLGVTAGSANVEDLVGLLDTGQTLTGSADANQIHGGAGDDVIDGGAGADTMTGGKGNDIYYVDDANDVVIENAGEGYDEVRTTVANYVLPANVEKLTYVGTGNFSATGSAGNDTISGGIGNDYFDLSQGGADTVSGGGGVDAFSFGAAFGAGDSVDGGAGSDTVGIRGDYTGANKLTIAAGQLVNVETLSIMTSLGGAVGYDIAWSDGNLATNQRMAIYAGNLQAGENVTFDGSAETHGYFVMYGGLGTDNLKGGSLSDGFYFGPGKFSQADHVDGGGGGQNQLGLDGSYDFSSTSALGTFGGNFTNIQTIVLYAGDPVYNIVTNDLAVAAGKLLTIFGTPVGSNLVFDGSAETDGAFKILSGTGDDTLTGGHGNDTLYGNLGADTLTGGAGNDVFLYTDAAQSTAAKTDHIMDFDAGDKVDLSQIDADSTQAGDQAFAYIGAQAFGHHAGELRADLVNGVWTIQGDLDGDGNADFTLLVTTANNHAMVNTDFVL